MNWRVMDATAWRILAMIGAVGATIAVAVSGVLTEFTPGPSWAILAGVSGGVFAAVYAGARLAFGPRRR